jgi:GMP synthase (glutamine-hydrolysing)
MLRHLPNLTQPTTESRTILAILHGEHSSTGRAGRLLLQMGYRLDIRRPRYGDPLPRTMEEHVGAIYFGGSMSANDEDEYIKAEIDWINLPLSEQKPFLGICLGAQMLARALGRRVYRHPAGRVEVGYYPIRPTQHGHAVCEAAFPGHVYHWHGEGFELPHGAELLAEGGDFEIQAMRYGPHAFGLQFHPEVTYAMICRWIGKEPEKMREPGARERAHHLDGWFMHDRAVACWLEQFLSRWISGRAGVCAARAA